MENKVRKANKEEIMKIKEQLGPRMKSPRPTGPSDPRSSKDIEFDNAQAMSRLTPDDKDKINKIKQMMDKEKPLKEAGPSNNPYYNNLVKKAKEMGIHVDDLMKSLLKDKSEMEIVKMGYQDVAALAGVENLGETDAIATARSLRPGGEEDEEQEEYDKGWYGESLKEIASKLGYLKESKFGDEDWESKVIKGDRPTDDAYWEKQSQEYNEEVDEQGLDQIEMGLNQITGGGRQSAGVSDRGDKIRVMFRYMRGEFDGETWDAILEYLSDNMGYKILDQSNYYEANYDREEPAEAVPTIHLQK